MPAKIGVQAAPRSYRLQIAPTYAAEGEHLNSRPGQTAWRDHMGICDEPENWSNSSGVADHETARFSASARNWMLIEEGFTLAREHKTESLFAISNGLTGTRASLEEGRVVIQTSGCPVLLVRCDIGVAE